MHLVSQPASQPVISIGVQRSDSLLLVIVPEATVYLLTNLLVFPEHGFQLNPLCLQ